MSVEESRRWGGRVGVALGVLAVVALLAGLVMLARKFISAPEAPRRQVARIVILPDTPPPPPPPRDEVKKEPPKEQPRQAQEQPRPRETPPPPTPAPLKMEGAAGDAPSAFQAGAVAKDYGGGTPTLGGASSPAGAPVADRLRERFYANAARDLLRDEIERQLRQDAGELTATFSLWVETDGRIRRYELQPSGVGAQDAAMDQALAGAARTLRLPPPQGLAQPMRFRLTVRAQG